MRVSIALAGLVLAGSFAGNVRAQESLASVDADVAASARSGVPHTPKLVIQEPAISPQTQKPVQEAAKPAKGSAKAATSSTNGAGAAAPVRPIIMSSDPATGDQTVYSLETTGNPKYDELVMQSAARNGVDPNLVMAVMHHESGFNPHARSYKGAMGLMQLMPGTARRFGVNNILDPAENIEGGTRYLRFLLDSFNGDIKLVLAGYNAGENAVVNSGYQVPHYRETQAYVRNISARYGSTKHRGAASKTVAAAAPTAPEAAKVSGRLSNNY